MSVREHSSQPRSASSAPPSPTEPAATRRARRCSATRADGRPCRAWAVRGTDPPLCAAHGGTDARIGAPPGNTNAVKHGYYAQPGTLRRMAASAAEDGDSGPTPDAPPALSEVPSRSPGGPTRVATPGAVDRRLRPVANGTDRRMIDTVIASLWDKHVKFSRYVDAHMDELSAAQLASVLRVEGQNASRLGRLLRDRLALAGDTHDRLDGAIAQALKELGDEWGVDLTGCPTEEALGSTDERASQPPSQGSLRDPAVANEASSGRPTFVPNKKVPPRNKPSNDVRGRNDASGRR